MQSSREENLHYLDELSETDIPEFFENLPDKDLDELKIYLENVVKHKTAGFENLYKVIADNLKYVPNFILHTLIKPIEAPILAAISPKVEFKELLNLAKEVAIEKVEETFLYVDKKIAAQILMQLKLQRARRIIEYVFQKNPKRILEFSEHLTDKHIYDLLGGLDIAVYETHPRVIHSHKDSYERVKNVLNSPMPFLR